MFIQSNEDDDDDDGVVDDDDDDGMVRRQNKTILVDLIKIMITKHYNQMCLFLCN